MSRSNRSACCASAARSQALSEAPVWRSLKRMLSIARAAAGMTLVAGLPTSMLVTCSVDGWNHSLPASSGAAGQRVQRADQPVDRIVGALRIGDVALHAVHGDAWRSGCRAGRS